MITRYSFTAGLAAKKLPRIVVSVIVPNDNKVGAADGVIQGADGTPVTVRLSMLIFGRDPVVPPEPL